MPSDPDVAPPTQYLARSRPIGTDLTSVLVIEVEVGAVGAAPLARTSEEVAEVVVILAVLLALAPVVVVVVVVVVVRFAVAVVVAVVVVRVRVRVAVVVVVQVAAAVVVVRVAVVVVAVRVAVVVRRRQRYLYEDVRSLDVVGRASPLPRAPRCARRRHDLATPSRHHAARLHAAPARSAPTPTTTRSAPPIPSFHFALSPKSSLLPEATCYQTTKPRRRRPVRNNSGSDPGPEEWGVRGRAEWAQVRPSLPDLAPGQNCRERRRSRAAGGG